MGRKEKNMENRIYHVYEAIGEDYNKIQDIRTLGIHRAVKLRLAHEIAGEHPQKVLEVCCGTGGFSFALARFDHKIRIDAVDFSDEMIRAANARKRRDGFRKVVFYQENAKHLSFPNDTYDCVVCAFGILQTDDPIRILAEMKRVLKPDGRLYLLEESICDDKYIKMFRHFYENSVAPAINEFVTGKGFESRWVAKTGKKPQSKERMAKILHQMGFRKISYRTQAGGLAAVHRAVK